MKDLLLYVKADASPRYGVEAEQFIEAFDAEAAALMHRDGYLVPAYETAGTSELRDWDGGIVVEIHEDTDEDPPTVSLITEFSITRLTWSQARALSVALAEVEQIARNG